MTNNTKLERVRRQISRLVLRPDEANVLVQALIDTDWSAVMHADIVKCFKCNCEILYMDAVLIPNSSSFQHKFCSACSIAVEVRKCLRCQREFQTCLLENVQFCGECRNQPSKRCACILCGEAAHLDMCNTCLDKRGVNEKRIRTESIKVMTHNDRAQNLNQPGTLTLKAWIAILDDFNWRCAYCLTGSYEQLDHFIPLCKGGATTVQNCVPACKICNALKAQTHPDKITSLAADVIERVRTYLTKR